MMRGSFAARSAEGRALTAGSASVGALAACPARAGGAPLVRLLARLAEADIAEPRQAFADRLSQWLSWTDAIALSSALGAPTAATPMRTRVVDGAFARQRDALVRAMRDDAPPEPRPGDRARAPRGVPARAEPAETVADFSSHRRRYLAKQQAMEAGVAALREGLRAALAARSPDLAKLAAVDAVMEQVLGERERELLSLVPVVLAQRFERLRQDELAARAAQGAHDAAPPDDGSAAAAPEPPDAAAPAATLSGAWLARFRKDLHELLQAELDLRLQPVEGLIDALASTGART